MRPATTTTGRETKSRSKSNDKLDRPPRAAAQILQRRHPQHDCLSGDPEMKTTLAASLCCLSVACSAQGLDPKALTLFNRPEDIVADLQRRLLRPPLQRPGPDQSVQHRPAEDRVDVPHHWRRSAARRRRSDHQIHAAAGQRHPLLHHSRSRLRHQRPHRRANLAVRFRRQRRPPRRPARRRHVWQLALLPDVPTAGSSRSTPRTAKSAGARRSPTRSCSTSPPWLR